MPVNTESRVWVFRTKMKEICHLQAKNVKLFGCQDFFFPPSHFELTQNKKKRPAGSNRIILNSTLPENLCWVELLCLTSACGSYSSDSLHLSVPYLCGWRGLGAWWRAWNKQKGYGGSVAGLVCVILFRIIFTALLGRFEVERAAPIAA
jgi:hypothetical protein